VSATAIQPSSVESLLELFERRGGEHYGEDVTQQQHALQCAELARRAGATDTLVAAALLHDVGHLAADARGPGWRDEVDDDHHEAVGARILASVFGPGVAAPVALHVVAKRWRCTVDPPYRDALSTASVATLVAQGGLLGAAERARFEAHPAFLDAVALRGWDDDAKDPGAASGTMRAFATMLARLAGAHAGHTTR
jgi:predicted HD phosphohydrolase